MMLRTLLVVAVVALCATPVHAQGEDPTDNERFRKKLSRYAPAPGKRARGLCICQDGSANHGRAGELHQEEVNQVRVTCLIPAFAGGGGFAGFSTCGTFESISR
jgi:hypothetical protein